MDIINCENKKIDCVISLNLTKDLVFDFNVEGKWYFVLLFPVYSAMIFIFSLIAYPAVIIKMLFAKRGN